MPQKNVVVLFLLIPLLIASDWPQWRGPYRAGESGLLKVGTTLPEGGLPTLWRKSIGGGYGGIAVVQGRVYVMDRLTNPREVERLLCLDAATGDQRWQYSYDVAYGKLDYGNGPRSTPTVQDGRVYAFGALGHLYCFDAIRGKAIWAHDSVQEFKGRVPTWGHSCSPLVVRDKVIVQIGGEPDNCVMAFDRDSGDEVWRALSDRPGYSSPVLHKIAGKTQLVMWTPEHSAGLNPEDGEVLWKVPFKSTYDVSISDPIWHDETLLLSGYWEGSQALQFDKGPTKPELRWDGKRLCLLMSTPLYRKGYMYALDKRDGLKCIELRTGEVKWEGQHITPKGRNPHASLVWAGSKALILNELGDLILAELTPERYREIWKTNIIAKGTWAHPAYADGKVFVRNDEEILCVKLPE